MKKTIIITICLIIAIGSFVYAQRRSLPARESRFLTRPPGIRLKTYPKTNEFSTNEIILQKTTIKQKSLKERVEYLEKQVLTLMIKVEALEQQINSISKIESKSDTSNIELSFFDIEYKMHKMNKSEWEIYRRNLVDHKVHWKGWVLGTTTVFDTDDVKILYVEMEDRLACFATQEGWDVLFWIPTDLASKLNSGMEIEFEGIIESVTNMYGELDIHLKNVSVLRYENLPLS